MKTQKHLCEVRYIPKGTNRIESVFIWAKNRLEAHNYMILNELYGKQIEIRYIPTNTKEN